MDMTVGATNDAPEMKNDFRTVFEEMVAAENDFDLFSQTAGGVRYWEVARFEVFHRLLGTGSTHQKHYDYGSKQTLGKMVAGVRGMAGAMRHQPFWPVAQAENLIWLHERKWKVGDGLVDPYLSWLVERIGADKCKVYDQGTAIGTYERRLAPFEQTFDGVKLLSRAYGRILRRGDLDDAALRLLGELEDRFFRTLGASIPLKDIIALRIRYFQPAYALYRRLLAAMKPGRLIVAVAYDRHPIVAAANDLGVETFEMQHGVIGVYHPGYNYRSAVEIPYKPRHLLSFGEFWSGWGPFAPNMEFHAGGAPTLHDRLSRYRDGREKDIDVVFVSQSEHHDLFDFAVETVRLMKAGTMVFRPHPREDASGYVRFLKDNPDIRSHLRVADQSEEPDTLALLARTRYQVGVYSTALLEGMQLGCTTIVVQQMGAELFEHLVRDGLCLPADTPADAVAAVRAGVRHNTGIVPFEPANERVLGTVFGC